MREKSPSDEDLTPSRMTTKPILELPSIPVSVGPPKFVPSFPKKTVMYPGFKRISLYTLPHLSSNRTWSVTSHQVSIVEKNFQVFERCRLPLSVWLLSVISTSRSIDGLEGRDFDLLFPLLHNGAHRNRISLVEFLCVHVCTEMGSA